MMKKLLLIFGLALALGIVSCNEDYFEDNFDQLSGRTWIGDMGVTDTSGIALESGIFLGADGFGTDKLYYYKQQGGGEAGVLNIQWDADQESLYLNYGNVIPPRSLRNIQIRNGELTGVLYVNAIRYYRVTLYME